MEEYLSGPEVTEIEDPSVEEEIALKDAKLEEMAPEEDDYDEENEEEEDDD